jgi:hypothetical protein
MVIKKMKNLKVVLGVVGSEMYNLETQKEDYSQKLVVEGAVYSWLLQHDIEMASNGDRIFICNNIKYRDLGIDLKTLVKDEK